MVAKKPKKSTNAGKAGKESDAEFLKRIMKMRDDATKKASGEMDSHSKSEEAEKLRETGKRAAKDLEEIEECERIIEEFKSEPPVVISKHINNISVEYRYEERFKAKIGLLKKHYFSFSSATKDTSIFTPHVKAYGRAYVKRGAQRIPLPADSNPPTLRSTGMGSQALDPKNLGFMLKDGDRIVTGDSYVLVNDFIANDDYRREMAVFPNSEAVVRLSEKITHPPPGFMDPSKVPDVIKKRSERTVMNYNISKFLLVKGAFKVELLSKDRNANPLLELPSGYPRIEFLHSSKIYKSIMDKEYAKLANVPNAASIIAMYNARKAKPKTCDQISAYVELCRDGSVVVFGTMNSVRNKGSGKVASITLPTAATRDFVLPGKITVVGNGIYTDKSGSADPRARAIMKYGFAIEQYTALSETKKDFEQKLKDAAEKKSKRKIPESKASKKEKEKRRKELLNEQNYLKKAGDDDMALAVQMQIDELDAPGEAIIDEEYVRKMLTWCDKELARLSPDLNTNFPAYNSTRPADAV